MQQECAAAAHARFACAPRPAIVAQEAQQRQAPVQVVVDGDHHKVRRKDVHPLRRGTQRALSDAQNALGPAILTQEALPLQ